MSDSWINNFSFNGPWSRPQCFSPLARISVKHKHRQLSGSVSTYFSGKHWKSKLDSTGYGNFTSVLVPPICTTFACRHNEPVEPSTVRATNIDRHNYIFVVPSIRSPWHDDVFKLSTIYSRTSTRVGNGQFVQQLKGVAELSISRKIVNQPATSCKASYHLLFLGGRATIK